MFLESPQAWSLAAQLLLSARPQQEQFIGAQILYKKLETHFEQIESKDDQVLEVRNMLLQLLPQCTKYRIVLDRLCLALALLALKTTHTCWGSSV